MPSEPTRSRVNQSGYGGVVERSNAVSGVQPAVGAQVVPEHLHAVLPEAGQPLRLGGRGSWSAVVSATVP